MGKSSSDTRTAARIWGCDDITDEHAFQALSGRGIGILVADPADLEIAGRSTAADYVLGETQEVERFLDALAR